MNEEKEPLPFLRNPIFAGIAPEAARQLIERMNGQYVTCKANEILLSEGEAEQNTGILLNGRLRLETNDERGDRCILVLLTAGDVFGNVCGSEEALLSPVTVTAAEPSRLLYLDLRILSLTEQKDTIRLLQNILAAAVKQNTALTAKLKHLSRRTTRRKVLSFLSEYAQSTGTTAFDIPFDRQGLADYLFLDRSALSAELSALRKEKIIDFHKNHFLLHDLTTWQEHGILSENFRQNLTEYEK